MLNLQSDYKITNVGTEVWGGCTEHTTLSTLVGYLMKLPFEGLLKFNNIDMERFPFNSLVPSLTADGQARFY